MLLFVCTLATASDCGVAIGKLLVTSLKCASMVKITVSLNYLLLYVINYVFVFLVMLISEVGNAEDATTFFHNLPYHLLQLQQA